MKVLLLNPPFKTEYGRFSRNSRSPAVAKSGTLYYPIWLAFVAGALEKAGHDVLFVDACADTYNREQTYELVRPFNPSFIVLDTSTPSIYNDVEIGGELKKLFPGSLVALMGTHPSAMPGETLAINTGIDVVIRGEADITALEIASLFERESSSVARGKLNEINGISFMYKNRVVHTPERERIKDLDSLPFLSRIYRKHLNYRNYFFSAAEHPMIMLMTSRGCPAKCKFCVYPQTVHKHQYVYRSVINIIQEMKYIAEAFPAVYSVGFEDDTFTFNKKRLQEFCAAMLDAGLHRRFRWWVNARVNTLDGDMMKMMKKAGCRLLIPGFESSSQEILDNIGKGTKVEDALVFMENARKAGLLVHGCFMVGNQGETRQSMEDTLRFALKLNPDTAQFFPMIPYPGTKAYEWALEKNYLRFSSFADWLTKEGLHNTILNPGTLTSEDLVRFCNYARRKYYIRISYILRKMIQSLSNLSELKRNVRAFRSIIFFLVKNK